MPITKKELESFKSALATLKERVKAKNAGLPTDEDGLKKMINDVMTKRDRARSGRKGRFVGISAEPFDPGAIGKISAGELIETCESPGEASDMVYLASKIMGIHPMDLEILDHAKRKFAEIKALDTATAGEGAEWIPTGFSSELIRRVTLALKVAALHKRIVMPTNPFTMPMLTGTATAYLAAESTADAATKFTASDLTTAQRTLTAIKMAVRQLISSELEEDAAFAVLPILREEIINALAEAQEKATINGDTAGTHMDSNVTDSADTQKAWDGYRKLALSAAKVDLSTFNIANLRAIRTAMGKYGVNPNNLAWVCSVAGLNKFMGLDELLTMEKYGPNATILTGEVAKVDNIPLIVSEFVYDNLNASGVYDGVTETKTIVALVYRPGWIYGDLRKVTVKKSSELYIETDQDVLVATQRMILKDRLDASAEKIVGLGYNIAT